jgi:hypothetical protein
MLCTCQVQEPQPPAEPKAEETAPAAPPPALEAPQKVELGESAGIRMINPLDFVKRSAPLLSQEKKIAPERALASLEEAAARNETCVWQRVRGVPCECLLLCMFLRQSPCVAAHCIINPPPQLMHVLL